MDKTLIILNPNAGSGQTLQAWEQIKDRANTLFDNPIVTTTEHIDDVLPAIEAAYAQGARRVFGVGGDGTNHSLINALIQFQQHHPDKDSLTYGMIPVGTGRDWARNLDMPLAPKQSLDWLANTPPRPVDIGLLETDTGHQEYFLNIASSGLGGFVADNVNKLQQRYPWTFFRQSFEGILKFKPEPIMIEIDGQVWHEGKAFIAVIANGRIFAHGMKIAPTALVDDGWFDVLVIEDVPRIQVLMILGMVYSGSHMRHPAVKHQRGTQVRISGQGQPVSIEMDGETYNANHLTFTVQSQKLMMLR